LQILQGYLAELAGMDVVFIEAAVLVGDEDDAVQGVGFDEEFELPIEGSAFAHGQQMPGKTGGAAGDGDAVVVGEAQVVMKEFVHGFAVAAVGTINGRGTDAFVDEGHGAGEGEG
jgi:hypothetical protein